MKYVYKYLERRFALQLVKGESMRIGTLSDFRKVEAHDSERGDDGEGTRILHAIVTGPPTPFTQRFLRIGGGARNISFEEVTFQEEQMADAYVYCTSELCSLRAMKLFKRADTRVRIEYPSLFFRAVGRELRRGGIEIVDSRIDVVTYGARKYEASKKPSRSAIFDKPSRFAKQQEVRMAWTSIKRIDGPRIIGCRKASKYCTIVKRVPA